MNDEEIKGKAILADLLYLPPIEFFVAIDGYDTLVLEGGDNYQKQTYRNRTSILLANKVESLSIPVQGGNSRQPYREIKIAYDQKWKQVHLRGIQSAYGKAPFYEYFYPYFEKVYQRNHDRLFDLNLELLTLCLKFLQREVKIVVNSEYKENAGIKDLRGLIHPKESYEVRNIYNPAPYMQLFGLDFVPNLSVIDLLFCEGPQAPRVIARSKKSY